MSAIENYSSSYYVQTLDSCSCGCNEFAMEQKDITPGFSVTCPDCLERAFGNTRAETMVAWNIKARTKKGLIDEL